MGKDARDGERHPAGRAANSPPKGRSGDEEAGPEEDDELVHAEGIEGHAQRGDDDQGRGLQGVASEAPEGPGDDNEGRRLDAVEEARGLGAVAEPDVGSGERQDDQAAGAMKQAPATRRPASGRGASRCGWPTRRSWGRGSGSSRPPGRGTAGGSASPGGGRPRAPSGPCAPPGRRRRSPPGGGTGRPAPSARRSAGRLPGARRRRGRTQACPSADLAAGGAARVRPGDPEDETGRDGGEGDPHATDSAREDDGPHRGPGPGSKGVGRGI
jgi:hypothetical protein